MKLILIPIFLILASCGGELIDQTENSEDNPQEVTLVREQQRTIRYDCEDNIISDKIETINSVSKRMRIDPLDSEGAWSFSANMGGDYGGSMQGSSGYFTIDMSPTVFNIQVYEGMNEIDYIFRYCYDVQTRTVTDDDGNE